MSQLRRLVTTSAGILVSAILVSVPPASAESLRSQQWYLDAWDMSDVWATTRGAGMTVALVDTGVQETHPDLVGQVVGAPLGSGDTDGHGTGMASLIDGTGTGMGGQGVYGVAPDVKIMSFKVATASNKVGTTVGTGIEAAADSPARIINISLAGPLADPQTKAAVAYALSKGKLVVAAAGNTDTGLGNGSAYPAAFPGVLAVSAVDQSGHPASNAVAGDWVSLSAPGENLPNACVAPSGYCTGTGSSGAAALTSGIAALLWSVHPDWTADQVIRRLIDTANRPTSGPVPSDTFGYGSVSPRKALDSTEDPGPADVNPLIGVRGDKPSSSPAPATPTATTTATPATTPVAEPRQASGSSSGGGNGALIGIAGGVGGVIVLGGATAFALNRRRARSG